MRIKNINVIKLFKIRINSFNFLNLSILLILELSHELVNLIIKYFECIIIMKILNFYRHSAKTVIIIIIKYGNKYFLKNFHNLNLHQNKKIDDFFF